MMFAKPSVMPKDGSSMFRVSVLVLFAINILSCASISKSKLACNSVAQSNGLATGTLGAYFFGNIFQYGECAISENLRIETGEYLENRSNSIVREITTNEPDNRESMIALYQLFGCDPKEENLLLEFSRKNKSEFFENSLNLSRRDRMLLIRKKLKEDSQMKEICFR